MSESHTSVSREAAAVFGECAFATGMAIATTIGPGKTAVMKPDAREFWSARHLLAIPLALERAAKKGQTWEKDHREIVLAEAFRLGRLAAEHALKAGSGDIVQITLEHVKAASKEVSEGQQCQAAIRAGGGGYCEVPSPL
jgi:hypothetical protein